MIERVGKQLKAKKAYLALLISTITTFTVLVTLFSQTALAAPLSVTLIPLQQTIGCGQEATVEATISGKGSEFGAIAAQHYEIRLVESDTVDDDWLIYALGEYPAGSNVAGNDAVAFRVKFRVKCSDDCEKLSGIGIDSLEVKIRGGAWVAQTQSAGVGVPLLQNPPAGQYDFETYTDTDDGGDFELSTEFFLSTWNYGGAYLYCRELPATGPGLPLTARYLFGLGMLSTSMVLLVRKKKAKDGERRLMRPGTH